jgi:hypothetical protein
VSERSEDPRSAASRGRSSAARAFDVLLVLVVVQFGSIIAATTARSAPWTEAETEQASVETPFTDKSLMSTTCD